LTSGTVVSETILMISSILVASTFSAMAVTNFSSFDASFKSRFSSTSEKILTEIDSLVLPRLFGTSNMEKPRRHGGIILYVQI